MTHWTSILSLNTDHLYIQPKPILACQLPLSMWLVLVKTLESTLYDFNHESYSTERGICWPSVYVL